MEPPALSVLVSPGAKGTSMWKPRRMGQLPKPMRTARVVHQSMMQRSAYHPNYKVAWKAVETEFNWP